MRNWTEVGIQWETEPVSRQAGDHYSDRMVVGNAELPRITSIDKAAAAGVGVLAWLNSSNSMRVRAQAIARSHKGNPEELREKVFAALLGQRATGGSRTVTIVVRNLPDGTLYEGNDENEFRAAFAASLVDIGVDNASALATAKQATF